MDNPSYLIFVILESNDSHHTACVELHCQILTKWSKLRSIILEVKPWSLLENKCCITLYLKEESKESVYDVKSGQVISPVKFKVRIFVNKKRFNKERKKFRVSRYQWMSPYCLGNQDATKLTDFFRIFTFYSLQ